MIDIGTPCLIVWGCLVLSKGVSLGNYFLVCFLLWSEETLMTIVLSLQVTWNMCLLYVASLTWEKPPCVCMEETCGWKEVVEGFDFGMSLLFT